MKRYNVLVTGVGAIIGYGIIKSLRASGLDVNIVGMDIFADAVGRHWCDSFVKAVPAAADNYAHFMRSLIETHDIDLVLPGIEQDMYRLNSESGAFDGLKVKLALNNRELIELSRDKWDTYRKLKSSGFRVIDSLIDSDFNTAADALGTPMLIKPRRSYASKGIKIISDEEEFDFYKKRLGDEFMVQRLVGKDNEEYTVAAFGLGDGAAPAKFCLRRKLSREGATAKAVVTSCKNIEHETDRLAELFKPVGPTNFQFRIHDGEPLLLEINPRISSSTSIRTAFGYNEAEMCVAYFLEDVVPGIPETRSGSAERFIDDVITYDSDHR